MFFQPEAIPSADQAAYQGSIEGSLLTPTPGEDNGTDQETRPILSLAFLELTFPYDGGNDNFGGTDEQFRLTMRLNDGKSGRINSFFDHMLPLYPISDDPNLPSGQEQPEPPIGNNVLMFNGTNDPYIYYSGHPGYDFSTYEHNQATTPVFAAADGVVFLVGKHSSGALFAKIKHTIIGVGNFQTIYWHLHPDKYYNDMLGKEGQPIKAGTRIGTMGNTGFSPGIHLHFEVRFDRNNDGDFSLSELVDPSGWIPSLEYPNALKRSVTGNFRRLSIRI